VGAWSGTVSCGATSQDTPTSRGPDRKRVLHFAPEACLADILAANSLLEYFTADLEPARAMMQMDIMSIPYPDSYFDVILCSHVLEHVPDDRRAMREIARVLKPSGWALLIVPIKGEVTFEDPLVTERKERLRLFGQEDHVRLYGRDFGLRMRDAGLDAKAISPSDILTPEECETLRVPRECEPIYRVSRVHGCVPLGPQPDDFGPGMVG
jgi:SAM-dependent methyltransferase